MLVMIIPFGWHQFSLCLSFARLFISLIFQMMIMYQVDRIKHFNQTDWNINEEKGLHYILFLFPLYFSLISLTLANGRIFQRKAVKKARHFKGVIISKNKTIVFFSLLYYEWVSNYNLKNRNHETNQQKSSQPAIAQHLPINIQFGKWIDKNFLAQFLTFIYS